MNGTLSEFRCISLGCCNHHILLLNIDAGKRSANGTVYPRGPKSERKKKPINNSKGGREGKGERNSATDDDRATASGDQPSTPLSSVAWSTTVTVAVGREIAACDLRLADDPEKKEKRENREDWRAGGVRHSVFNNSARITFDGITNLRLTREPCGF